MIEFLKSVSVNENISTGYPALKSNFYQLFIKLVSQELIANTDKNYILALMHMELVPSEVENLCADLFGIDDVELDFEFRETFNNIEKYKLLTTSKDFLKFNTMMRKNGWDDFMVYRDELNSIKISTY